MEKRRNFLVWAGFLVAVGAFLSYYLFFLRFPVTRDFPWANLLLFALAGYLLGKGLRRAFGQPEAYGGKVSGSILLALSVIIFGVFGLFNFYLSKQLPPSLAAPRVGQKAPDFSLPDQNNHLVSLADLLSSPASGEAGGTGANGVLLVFYRGYW